VLRVLKGEEFAYKASFQQQRLAGLAKPCFC
jgi:hypothetical protein